MIEDLNAFKNNTAKPWAKYWVRRLWKNGGWTVIFINLIIIWIPAYYSWTLDVPTVENMKKSEGKLVYKYQYRSDNIIGLDNGVSIEYYSCRRDGLSNKSGCLAERIIRPMEGAYAEILWFEQKSYPWKKYRRLMQLTVNGEVKYDLAKAMRLVDFAKESAFWIFFVVLVCSIIVVRAYDKQIMTDKDE